MSIIDAVLDDLAAMRTHGTRSLPVNSIPGIYEGGMTVCADRIREDANESVEEMPRHRVLG